MKTEPVGRNIQTQPRSGRRPGENIWYYWQRLDEEQAARDPAYAARLEMERRRAETSYAVDHDLGGD